MQHKPVEDAFPLDSGDFPALLVYQRVDSNKWNILKKWFTSPPSRNKRLKEIMILILFLFRKLYPRLVLS